MIAGVEQKAHYLTMDLPHSEDCFVVAFPAETTEAFLEGHVQAFAYFGGVPTRILYDNTKIAVAKILGGEERQRTRAFSELQSYYLFADKFGRPAKGNDKPAPYGQVFVRGVVRARSRGWSGMRDATSWFRFRAPTAGRSSTHTSASSAASGASYGCAGTRRPSVSASSATALGCCRCPQLHTKPARRSRCELLRCYWFAIGATTTRYQPSTDTVRFW